MEHRRLRSDTVVSLLAKRITVFLEQVGIGIVILDRGGGGPVFQLRRVRAHGKQVDVRQLAIGFSVIRVADLRELVVLVGPWLVGNVGSGETGMVEVLGGRHGGVPVRAVARDQFDAVPVTVPGQHVPLFRGDQCAVRDDPVESAGTVCFDKLFSNRLLTRTDPRSDSNPVAGKVLVRIGRFDDRSQRGLNNCFQDDGGFGAGCRLGLVRQIDGVLAQRFQRVVPVAVRQRSTWEELVVFHSVEQLPRNDESNRQPGFRRQAGNVVQRRFLIDQTVLPRFLCDEMCESAAIRLAHGNHGLIVHRVAWTEPDDGRFGWIVDGGRPEH